MNNKEIAKELYDYSNNLAPGEVYHFSQLKLIVLGTRGPRLRQGAPAGEVQVRNTFHGDALVESLTPSAYDSWEDLYSNLCDIENYNPKNLKDWLNRNE